MLTSFLKVNTFQRFFYNFILNTDKYKKKRAHNGPTQTILTGIKN